MKIFFFCLLFLIIFSLSNEIMTEKQRQNLLKKYTKKINIDNIEDINPIRNILDKIYLGEEEKNYGIKYDISKIDEIRNKYGFEQNYNFLEKHNIKPVIKNQKNCGCCWSHSSVTALAYRYNTSSYHLNLDLSPQYALSCYLPDCEAGNTIVDAQLNLIKNGTVLESCLPFVSGDRYIPFCPSKCKDGSEFKFYKAKNAYFTGDLYNEENFYDIVAIIMDQLVNYGPVVSGFSCYEDLRSLSPEKCKNNDYIYRYDGKSESAGGHAVVIVGYGFQDNKYYWIIQNSWGTTFCNNGFTKIEFGQVRIEQVSFAEPYLPNNTVYPDKINIEFNSIDKNCDLDINFDPSLDSIENDFEINFKHKSGEGTINFICGRYKKLDQNYMLKCYFEDRIIPKLGEYEFNYLISLGSNNIYNYDSSFIGKTFEYQGMDEIRNLYKESKTFYISEEGSKIIFIHLGDTNPDIRKQIYPHSKINQPLKNCFDFTFMGYNFISCEVTSDEINNFYEPNYGNDLPMEFKTYCGRHSSGIIAYKLDTNKYPVFRIYKFYTKSIGYFSSNTEIIAQAYVEGSISNFNFNELFVVFGYVIRNQYKNQIFYQCYINKKNNGNQTEISCYPDLQDGTYNYERLYFQPYILPIKPAIPYEVILNNTLLVEGVNKGSHNNICFIMLILLYILII